MTPDRVGKEAGMGSDVGNRPQADPNLSHPLKGEPHEIWQPGPQGHLLPRIHFFTTQVNDTNL